MGTQGGPNLPRRHRGQQDRDLRNQRGVHSPRMRRPMERPGEEVQVPLPRIPVRQERKGDSRPRPSLPPRSTATRTTSSSPPGPRPTSEPGSSHGGSRRRVGAGLEGTKYKERTISFVL